MNFTSIWTCPARSANSTIAMTRTLAAASMLPSAIMRSERSRESRWVGEERCGIRAEERRVGSRRHEEHRPASGAVMQERREHTDEEPHQSVENKERSTRAERT